MGAGRLCVGEDCCGNEGPAHRAARHSGGHDGSNQHRRARFVVEIASEFAFEGLGTLGSLGHGAAVAQIFGVKLSGLIAWILWRCIYLMKMPGLNRKVRISTDWLLHLLFPPELAQTKVAFEHGIKNQHFEPGDMVFQQGDVGDSVYVIQDGECDVLRGKDGSEKLLATLRPATISAKWRCCPIRPGTRRFGRVPP